MYRPPGIGVEASIKANCLSNKINAYGLSHNGSLLVLGDFNIPLSDWLTGCGPVDGVHDVKLNCITDLQLTQIVDMPTRGERVLDLVFVSLPSIVLYPTIKPPLGASDHNIMLFSFIQQNQIDSGRSLGSIPTTRTIWPPLPIQCALEYLENYDWSLVFSQSSTPFQVWNDFKMILHHGVSTFAVKIRVKIKDSGKIGKKGLITSTVRRLLNVKKRLWRRLHDLPKSAASYTTLKNATEQ